MTILGAAAGLPFAAKVASEEFRDDEPGGRLPVDV
jgi:hypothetical protein